MAMFSYLILAKLTKIDEYLRLREIYRRAPKLMNSFLGMEKPVVIPPTWIFTGPLMKEHTGLMEAFKVKDEKLFNWVE